MRTVYIANDGTWFDDEWDCEEYEFSQTIKEGLDRIQFINAEGKRIDWDFTDEFYGSVEKVIISDREALEALRKYVEYTGFCEFDFEEIGIYNWSKDISSYYGCFVKE